MNILLLNIISLTVCLFSVMQAPYKPVQQQETSPAKMLEGAWTLSSGNPRFATLPEGATAVALVQDGYFSVTYFDRDKKKFWGTYGGTLSIQDSQLTQTLEFNTLDTASVGRSYTYKYTFKNRQLQLQDAAATQVWQKAATDDAAAPLEGTWRITGRAGEDGTLNPMRRGPRKTLKILTGGRFQWIAFNTATKEFSGTGGGTYTAKDGTYTERIEFFSRDSSRVGASLSFTYEVADGKWLHSGQSSTGKLINEVWERENPSQNGE
ncbi:membrane or secreted protein [Pontibacter mangrovi]|uniref:membrane or secreted protein n=1 Tax=Pontibacter mangrovi TaxID=2589816 RepID=UPI0015E3BA05|nr:membrane or secreted protein [Pontibacter mangrovi]